jgi:hypothetical protein
MDQEPSSRNKKLLPTPLGLVLCALSCFGLLLAMVVCTLKGQWPPAILWLALAMGLLLVLRRMGGIERSESGPKWRRPILLGVLVTALTSLIIGGVSMVSSFR